MRRLDEKDIAAILAIENESFSSPYNEQQYVFELEDNPCSYLFGYEEKGELKGFIDFWITFESCQLTKIAVAKQARGKHISLELMDFMIDFAMEKGCETIFLEVRESNEVAKNLYESYDFIEINRRQNYYPDNHETAIVMGKAIGGLGE